jgi:hypothetical protein
MPGIYLNDGGATSSALGNALGGLAGAFSPENQAKAALIKLQSEQADWQNRQLSDTVNAAEQAAAAAPGILSTFGANAVPPDGSGGGVPGAVAAVAQPPDGGNGSGINAGQASAGPSGRTVLNTSGFTPYQKFVANEIMAGRMSPDALKTAINTGQAQTRGPGNTDQAIATRSTTPLSPGTVINTTGQPGSPTISGGSEYGSTVERTGGQQDPTAAKADAETGAAADANLGKTQKILGIYNQFVAPNANPTGILTEEIKQKLSDATGLDLSRFTSTADARNEIKKMFASMVANLRDSQGQPMFRGGLDQIMQQFPDPTAEPERFKSTLQALQTSLARQSKDGQAAMKYLANPTPQAYNTFLQEKGANAAQEGAAYASAGIKPSSEGGDGGSVYIYPDQASAEAAVAAGHLPKGSKVKIGGPNGASFTVGE